MIAALYVDVKRGPYVAMEGVECWGVERDARLYPGPHPVVCHPPCQRWGNYWSGGPSAPVRRLLGDDGGCFTAALAAVRRWGGVLEHPARSRAWKHFGLIAPGPEGWTVADEYGWTCQVEQGHFGHFARKASWLYAVRCELPLLPWGLSGATGVVEHMDKKKRHLTPQPFADLLASMARSAR